MTMKNWFKVGAAALAVAVSFGGFAEETQPVACKRKPLKVLMIGNSFSICVLHEMPKIAADLNLPLDLCSMYIGGCSLERHMQNVKAPETKPYKITWNYVSAEKDAVPFKTLLVKGGKDNKEDRANIPEMLKADAWDVVTIQQASHGSWQPATYEPYGTQLIDTIKEAAPQAKIVVQQTWSYTPWDKRLGDWGIDQNSMFGALEAAYNHFAKRHGLEIIPTGKAVQAYRKQLPVVYTEKSNDDDVCGTSTFVKKDGKWSPKGDVFHFNARGHFLQGLVWTAKLFNVDVTKGAYVPKCLEAQPERAKLMRRIVTDTVFGK
ncbi:MAG: DUF4886 domain-containing protein [Kiritimatiellia bacterium]